MDDYCLQDERETWENIAANPGPPQRCATVTGARTVREVEAYLPSNYRVVAHRTVEGRLVVYIAGHDSAGWTLEGYVVPRLASGLMYCCDLGVKS